MTYKKLFLEHRGTFRMKLSFWCRWSISNYDYHKLIIISDNGRDYELYHITNLGVVQEAEKIDRKQAFSQKQLQIKSKLCLPWMCWKPLCKERRLKMLLSLCSQRQLVIALKFVWYFVIAMLYWIFCTLRDQRISLYLKSLKIIDNGGPYNKTRTQWIFET